MGRPLPWRISYIMWALSFNATKDPLPKYHPPPFLGSSAKPAHDLYRAIGCADEEGASIEITRTMRFVPQRILRPYSFQFLFGVQ